MIIKKACIKNFKCLKNFEIEFNEDINIIVGDNEIGKSTILEAINLALTRQINGRNVDYFLSPYFFNMDVVNKYINDLKENLKPELPEISIELYLNESEETTEFKGTNNRKREDCPGISLKILFNDEFSEEYEKYIEDPSVIKTIPIEYYEIKWYSFAHNPISKRTIPLSLSLIDTTTIQLQSGSDVYLRNIINSSLAPKERANLSLTYRNLKEKFAEEESIKSINEQLTDEEGLINGKPFSVSIDISQKTNWEANLTSYLKDIPFQFIGKGEQSFLKINLAFEIEANQSQLILIEEPENHLSFSNLNVLINKIQKKCEGKQLIVTTHSTFILNKLGIDRVIMLGKNQICSSLNMLEKTTFDYFKKLPGYDTLRLLLSKKTILVEGPSDDLIVQRAYLNTHEKLPIEDGIDIISVKGLAFKRFLEIAKLTKNEVVVVTDNDGNVEKLERKYEDFEDEDNIKICFDRNENLKTLEPQIVDINSLENLNSVLDRSDLTKDEAEKYMTSKKTEAALKIFDSETELIIPQYILDAIE